MIRARPGRRLENTSAAYRPPIARDQDVRRKPAACGGRPRSRGRTDLGHVGARRLTLPLDPTSRDHRMSRAINQMLIEALHRRPGLVAGPAMGRGRIGPPLFAAGTTGRDRDMRCLVGLPATRDLDRQRLLDGLFIWGTECDGNRAWTPRWGDGGRDRARGCRPTGRHPAILSQTCTSVTQPAVECSG